MQIVEKAVWFIESRLMADFSLEDVAAHAGTTRFHLTRAFGEVTGHSVISYVRARRLGEAAKVLAGGAEDILTVALDTGYSSHEAFTRAFRTCFGLTPEQFRAQSSENRPSGLEPFKMNTSAILPLDPHRIEPCPDLTVAGLGAHYSFESMAAIPAQWQQLAPHLGSISGQVQGTAYGVVFNGGDDGFDYLCGVAITGQPRLPQQFSTVQILGGNYAVFHQKGHISTIRSTCQAIWSKALPEAGLKLKHAPWFEKYGPSFNPVSGMGGFEIWVPIEA